jgi:superfamily II DNA or RNA helicase
MFIVNVYNDKSIVVNDQHPQGRLDHMYQEAIRLELSYDVPDAEWSAKFKQGQWDGKISVYNKRDQSFPTGLTNKLKSLFDLLKVEYKFVDKRQKPDENYPVDVDFGGKELRDYQLNSGLLSKKFQRGMLALCTGAGKTMTSCQIFKDLAVSPVVFIVPAIELLKQTQKEFEKYLRLNNEPVKVGIAGGGLCDLNLNGINVITYQTALNAHNKKYVERGNKIIDDESGDGQSKSTAQLQAEYDFAEQNWIKAKEKALKSLSADSLNIKNIKHQHDQEKDLKKKKVLASSLSNLEKAFDRQCNQLVKVELSAYRKAETAWNRRQDILLQKSQVRELLSQCQAFIVDEAHVASVVIEELGKYAKNAYYKLGLSGTPWRTDNQEIRIEGALGRKIIQVSASDLIERGFLVKPKIFVCKVNEVNEGMTYPEIYSSNIVNNWERNFRIKQFAEEFKQKGRPTLILVERREHGSILESMIEDSVFVPGGDKGEEDPTDEEKNYRRRMLNAVEDNEIILIATQWANVGVDAPKISCLILAGSNQSSVTTYQQVGRVLRCVGKNIEDSINNGKPDAIILDFTSDQKNLKAHANMRKKVYKNERAWNLYELK